EDELPETIRMIGEELEAHLEVLHNQNKLVEYQRLQQRTNYDIEMLEETGRCSGIENYSRIMTRRKQGEAPPTLINYLPKDALIFMDESHVSLPQINGMYKGDFSRKTTLVDYGFRLPSALDNRPLKYEEFDGMVNRVIYVSATPGDKEMENTSNRVVEQLIRPTGLLDPPIEIRPTSGQVDEMYGMIKEIVAKKERVLITTLTKRMAEDLTEYYNEMGLRIRYLHSDIDTIERSEIIRDLRLGEFDVLVGINLLREGLDIPEVSLVAIFDADKEGFLRSTRSLLQTCGRAARNVNGRVVMFADKITNSMRITLDETERRRQLQQDHNELHGIIPKTIIKKIQSKLVDQEDMAAESQAPYQRSQRPENSEKLIKKLTKEMNQAAKGLDFEKAAQLRDEIEYWRMMSES
ncbi:MAG: excinuclease ABC subunit B, partial [Proteobacteria bacterium]|nr:excinuclease ABC subunit B [Pseudomonadota bacterium]